MVYVLFIIITDSFKVNTSLYNQTLVERISNLILNCLTFDFEANLNVYLTYMFSFVLLFIIQLNQSMCLYLLVCL
jgi:hypothetical protein